LVYQSFSQCIHHQRLLSVLSDEDGMGVYIVTPVGSGMYIGYHSLPGTSLTMDDERSTCPAEANYLRRHVQLLGIEIGGLDTKIPAAIIDTTPL
jgi:hypothetical protein